MTGMMRDMEMQYVKSPRLHSLIQRADALTTGDRYELYDKNSEVLQRILIEMLNISKRENEWYCYFMTINNLIYLFRCSNEYKK